jgi:hypothetical protein
MQFFLLGLVLLVVVLVTMRGFTRANPAAMARQLRVMGGIAAFAVAGLLALRGLVTYAAPLAAVGYWLMWGSGRPKLGGWGGSPSRHRASRVVTDTLEVELDHDTGTLAGTVRTGPFQGRTIDSLTPAELAEVWRDCRFSDPQSAQILEAWLDRTHPSWHDDLARAADSQSSGPSGGQRTAGPPPRTPGSGAPMSKAEAYDILGLHPGASTEEIRRAHRDLMMKLHPDRGGSTYLAAKLNEAKDLLLDG